MTKKNKIRIVFVSVILAVMCIYFLLHGWAIAYTDDAYIRANISVVSPRVEGHILNIYVKSNQFVKSGTLLMELDPYPYQLRLDVRKSALLQAETNLKSLTVKYQTSLNTLNNVTNEYKLATINYERYKTLQVEQAASRQIYEQYLGELDEARNKYEQSKADCQYDQNAIDSKQVEIDSLKSQVALAQYELDQTKVYAPADGYVTNFNIMPGDFAAQGQQMFVIIEDGYWWAEANYKESVLRHIKPGQTVYILTDMYPFRLLKGKVEFIGRGTSRSPTPDKVLPYIEPTTDWIRLQRRFSVRITFDNLPEDVKLAEGANARTFIIL